MKTAVETSQLLYTPSPPPARSKAAEEKFVKLREVYQKLRSEHIVLLRTNGETQKKIQATENSAQEAEAERMVGHAMSVCFSVCFSVRLYLHSASVNRDWRGR